MHKSVDILIMLMILIGAGCAEKDKNALAKDTPSPGTEPQWEWIFGSDQWKEFLYYRAGLHTTSTDQQALHMAGMAASYLKTDPNYVSGGLQPPDLRYFSVDYFGRKTESYYLVWLPDEWDQQQIKKAVLFSQGHASREPVGFSKLHVYAAERNMAVFMPQLWIEGTTPYGWTPYEKTPREKIEGLPDGYHLDAKDEFLFLNALTEEHDIDSVYVYGFSMSGATSMMVTSYDKYRHNVVDFTVISGGCMMYDHPFLKEMDGLGLKNYLEGENFFFFGELDKGEDIKKAQEEDVTIEIITEHGGTLVMEEWREVPHGGLLTQEHELMEASFDAYEEIAKERWI